ncbi:sigma-54 interaction domain-containing protein [Peribacillus simplex]|uniref:Sigma-54 dependent transcriptional regulator n=1 Tax=Peribacillus simplex TaxID=1478 RepID=A0AAN2PBQ1_9BACI|nr:sigma-54 dependent transcriptional regulator [Peribacillus simplex]CEG24912.1 sigma-54 dependent transcriptional regulator [Peribacillus simplex]
MEQRNSFSCLLNDHGIIIKMFGDMSKVLEESSHLLAEGINFSHVKWQDLFLGGYDLKQDVQLLQTLQGTSVIVHSISLLLHDASKKNKLVTFINLSNVNLLVSKQKRPVSELIINSPSMQKIINIIEKVSDVNSTVLLLGESGVGKSAIAKLIHQKSTRNKGSFISINCSTLPENLVESELFGYEAGTFTGGKNKGKTGLFQAAEKGTIFLDEIAELPLNAQSKLLDVIQENRIRKVGGTTFQMIDVRLIAATNKNLSTLVEKQLFREDLFYRLNVIPLTIPPLRERKESIPELAQNFLHNFNRKYNRNYMLDQQLLEEFMDSDWPGNVRELENTIERLVVTNLSVLDTPSHDGKESNPPPFTYNPDRYRNAASFSSLKEAKEALEKDLILQTYHVFQNTYKTARYLNVDQSTISKKLKKYNSEN